MINKVTELKLKVRNKGYSGEVSRKLLKELVSLNGRIGFRGYTKNDIVERSNGVLTYSPTNIVNNKIVNYKNDTYISQDKYKESPEIMVKNNDILFVKTGSTLGKSALVRNLTEPATINPQLIVIKTIHVDSDYLAVYLLTDSIQKQVFQVKIGGAVPTLTETEIGKFVVKLPPLPEQTAIGSLFRTLDDLLASYKENLANYQSLKATMLSKMFPKVGQTVPEIRLEGFEGEWEEKKLGSLGSVAMNKRIFKDETSEYGDIPFYKIGTFGGTADSFITKEKFKEYKEKYPYPEIGDILISASGSIGRTVVYNGEDAYYQDSNIVWLKHDQQLDNSYLKQYYGIIKWSGIEGTTIKRLYNKNILETNIFLPPSVVEQRAIGTYFSNLDNLINSYQEKISQLETLKKKLLQDMFI
ncbi:restriction endonuclease subunit S [Streptococcus thermophilus]|nr:restriction endonuclease subunit S [Streptococcus thermophilus]MCE2172681.1 restriction endonuclease subunit S [Streptococcus thermophilus]MCE2175965.1 restriction endonuclease subunit S [Streptococcus thermophilus]MCE2177513.1 restriction endonuclease subunit S [Streptococcus thermophilus]MCE2179444.1 restriction endonuclease subunit S [Streptococcus thermophilus]